MEKYFEWIINLFTDDCLFISGNCDWWQILFGWHLLWNQTVGSPLKWFNFALFLMQIIHSKNLSKNHLALWVKPLIHLEDMPMDQDKDINNQVITCCAWRQERNWGIYELAGTGLGLVSTMQNFVCFAKKSVNRKPFLVSGNCALACAVALVSNFCSRSTRKF